MHFDYTSKKTMTTEILSISPCKKMGRKNSKESIHSGHFMVSNFEAEAQDDEGLEVPEQHSSGELFEEIKDRGVRSVNHGGVITYAKPSGGRFDKSDNATVSIDGSLTKLFTTMSLAYRHNITSPKWNRFKGLRLRWKDKIRLNNVIWRCWHMQFMLRKRTTVCQFALDVDIHNKPEAVVLEGKYWKRRLQAVTAEYKKWRGFYKNLHTGRESIIDPLDPGGFGIEDLDSGRSFFGGGFFLGGPDLPEFDLMDVLFSPMNSNQGAFHFPNPREIAHGTENSDLLQPGLIQLQPDLPDDIMDFHEMLAGRVLPTVPEEEFFPDVEAAGLPPPSPPSVSTPQPTTLEYNAHLTATQVFPEVSSSNTSLYSPLNNVDYVISHHHHNHSPAQQKGLPHYHTPTTHILPQHPGEPTDLSQTTHTTSHSPQSPKEPVSPTSYRYEALPQQQQQHQQLIARSQSQQELDSAAAAGGLAAAAAHPLESSSFAMPKGYVRRRSHSGSIPFASGASTINAQVINAISAPSLPSVIKSGLPPLHSTAQSLQQNHNELLNLVKGNEGLIQSTSNAALFNQLINTDTFSSVSTIGHNPTTSSIDPLSLKIKSSLPLVLPRVVPESPSSRSNSSSSLSSINSTSSSSSNLNSLSAMPSIQLLVSQPSLLPNVTLSAVTPPSMKTLQVCTPVSHWSASTSAGPSSSVCFKSSPPRPGASPPIGSVPSPPNKPFRPKNEVERVQYREHRRVCHINAEQKRRCNIKSNFEMLHHLIPSVSQNPTGKVSKATMLHKGADYIQQLKEERKSLTEQAKVYRSEIEKLRLEISTAQSLLPATGAPLGHSRHNKLRERFDSYVKEESLINWKFWIFSLVSDPLLESFNCNVSTASVDDLCRSSMAWLDQHCSLNTLRPVASDAMVKLSTSTSILAAPEKLRDDIYTLILKQESPKRPASSYSPSTVFQR